MNDDGSHASVSRLPLCPYCFGNSQPFVSSTDRNRRTTNQVFHYYQCDNCRLVFIHPVPSDLTLFYKGGYQAVPNSLSELRVLAARERYRMKPILRYKNTGSLLDIGPWIGIFACNAKDAGFDVTAIEMDLDCVDFLNRTVGVKALQSSDPADVLGRLNEKFDVITLWHSLEHMRRPWSVIEEAAKHLAPGGILVISIPNIESCQFSLLKTAWKHLDTPRHLYFYPLESLTSVCQRYGLSSAEATTGDEISRVLSDDSWYSVADSVIPIRYAREVVFHVLRRAARRAEGRAGAGAGLTAIFQLGTVGEGRRSVDVDFSYPRATSLGE